MKILMIVMVYAVAAISGNRIIRQFNSSNQASSSVTSSCDSLTLVLLEPKYGYILPTIDYQVHDNACMANVSEAYEASTTCLATDRIRCGFHKIPFNSLASRCCERRCEMFSYIMKSCSSCPLTYVRLVLEEPNTPDDKCLEKNGTFSNQPIAAQITIHSYPRPRVDLVRSAFEKWKRSSNGNIAFSDLKYTILERDGFRYQIIFWFKQGFQEEFWILPVLKALVLQVVPFWLLMNKI